MLTIGNRWMLRECLLRACGFLGLLVVSPATYAQSLQLDWITQYCNESIQTTELSTPPRMLRNISNSLMTSAPSYLDGSVYLQRRTNFVSLCPSLNGIGELSSEWLRADRVQLSHEAVVVAAVPEIYFPGAATLFNDLGWTAIGDNITLNYFLGAEEIRLYAGLVSSGPVHLSGEEINGLKTGTDPTTTSIYFFFLEKSSFPVDKLGKLDSVSVPEASSLGLCFAAMCAGILQICRKNLFPQ